MFNKTNKQIHNGNGNQYINQNVTNNLAINPNNDNNSNDSLVLIPIGLFIFTALILALSSGLFHIIQTYKIFLLIILSITSISFMCYLYRNIDERKEKLFQTAFFLINLTITTLAMFQVPETIQTFLDSINGYLDLTSFNSFISSLPKQLIPQLDHILKTYPTLTILLSILYSPLLLLNIFIPILNIVNIKINRPEIKLTTYILVISFMFIYLLLNIL